MKAGELAVLVGGELAGPDRIFVGVAPVEFANEQQAAYQQSPGGPAGHAGVLLSRVAVAGRTCVVVPDPKRAFVRLLEHLFPETHAPGIHPGAWVDPSATLGAGVVVHPGAWGGAGCAVGAGTILFPGVVVYPGTVIGARCRIHAGAVLGADGFSYHPSAGGPLKVPQVGRLVLGDDVEVGANSTIDRAFLGETRLDGGVKLDNLVHVGHNSRIGAGTVVAAQSGVSGSCEIGSGCQIGGQVGIADHATVGAGARLGARSAVHGRLAGGASYLGVPAAPVATARRAMLLVRRLPEMWHMLHHLRRVVRELEAARGAHVPE